MTNGPDGDAIANLVGEPICGQQVNVNALFPI